MKFTLLLLAGLVAAVSCTGEKKDEKLLSEHKKLLEQGEHLHVIEDFHQYDAHKMLDFFLNNPVTKKERECFEKNLQLGDSIDFVIDLAPSPSQDKFDRLSANSPVGLYLERGHGKSWIRSTTRSYFDYISLFIDVVSFDMKPELTHVVLVDKDKRKFYLRGRSINETIDVEKTFGGEFIDAHRNLKTMWPASTRSKPETHMAKILVNNLGRMTKLALWNRDNGLPVVLNGSRRSKPVLSIVLTDGSSGLSIGDLVDDVSKSIVLDIGNHRFVDKLKLEDVRKMPCVYTLTAPQTLMAFANSVRHMSCLLSSEK